MGPVERSMGSRRGFIRGASFFVGAIVILWFVPQTIRRTISERSSTAAQVTVFPTNPPHLAAITPVFTATLDPSGPTPFFIDSEALAIQYVENLTETSVWVDHVVKRSNLQTFVNEFVSESPSVPYGDDLVWIVIFESSTLMLLSQVVDRGDEWGRAPGGYVAFLSFDDHGNVFGSGFLDRVNRDGSVDYDAGDWKTRVETIEELP